ncbi:hypothetical protein E8E15_006014 [Penicillium rubens]|nr:hypothetical protein E8E15_006014 [Penicillium rubens]
MRLRTSAKMYGSAGTEEEEGLAKVLELIVGIQIVFSDETIAKSALRLSCYRDFGLQGSKELCPTSALSTPFSASA